jgi:hypothetical protein
MSTPDKTIIPGICVKKTQSFADLNSRQVKIGMSWQIKTGEINFNWV